MTFLLLWLGSSAFCAIMAYLSYVRARKGELLIGALVWCILSVVILLFPFWWGELK